MSEEVGGIGLSRDVNPDVDSQDLIRAAAFAYVDEQSDQDSCL
jgi:hypothetical protein